MKSIIEYYFNKHNSLNIILFLKFKALTDESVFFGMNDKISCRGVGIVLHAGDEGQN